MATCPTCQRTYPDDQAFCLDDGTKLVREPSPGPAEPTLVSFQPPPTLPPTSYQPQPTTQPGWTPPVQAPQAAWTPPPQSPPPYPPAAVSGGKRRMGIATIALVLGFVCLALMIHLIVSIFTSRGAFILPAMPRMIFSLYGLEFFFALVLVGLTVVLAAIAIALAFRQPAAYAGRGRSLAAILMSVLSTIIAVSAFSIVRASYWSSRSRSYTPLYSYTPTPTPTPKVESIYAKDLIKPTMGSFTLIKTMTREDVRKVSSGEMLTAIQQANDVAAGAYRSSDSQTLSLIVSSYPTSNRPADFVTVMERSTQGSGFRSTRTVQATNGKRVEAESNRGDGLVVWNNGFWLFIVWGPTLPDAVALADAVGY